MKVSDYLVSFIESRGVDVIFGYIGGMITHLVDSIDRNPNVRFIQTYHEQTAAIAAEGYARDSGKFGVAIATSGPGATNLITGIADAYFDSVPVLFITGQVNTYEYKGDKPIRQQGFQETPVCELVAPITKYTKMVERAEDIPFEMAKALDIALSGRPGPVLLDIPMDVSRAEIEPDELAQYPLPVMSEGEAWPDREAVVALIEGASRPMVLVGGGCGGPEARRLVDEFLGRSGVPFVTSLMGRGLVDESRPGFCGMIGSYGNRSANMSVSRADVLLVLGSRLDTRQTGAFLEGFLPEGKVVHVDLDVGELDSHRLDNRVKVNLSVERFLVAIDEGRNLEFGEIVPWLGFVNGLGAKYNQVEEVERFVDNKAPYTFLQQLNPLMSAEDVVCVDIGQNQMWAAQTLHLKKGQRFLTSGGLAPMGYALPVAVGCAFSNQDRSIYSINGDGGFHMALQSLMLISQYDLPIKVIVLNNSSLGMITQFQHLYFEGRMAGTTPAGGYLVPDIEHLASAYGLSYLQVDADDLASGDWTKRVEVMRNGIIEVKIDGLTTVSPKLEYNKPIERSSPFLSEEELSQSLDISGLS